MTILETRSTDPQLPSIKCPGEGCTDQGCPAHYANDYEVLQAKCDALLEALEEVLPFVITDATQCRGDKCRDIWCISCQGEEDAWDSAARANQALHRASEALSAHRKGGDV